MSAAREKERTKRDAEFLLVNPWESSKIREEVERRVGEWDDGDILVLLSQVRRAVKLDGLLDVPRGRHRKLVSDR